MLALRLVAGPEVGWADARPPSDAEEHLRIRIEAIQSKADGAALVSNERLGAASTVARYYHQAAFDLAWTRPTGPTAQVDSLLSRLRAADREGLRPADYHLMAIDSLQQRLQARSDTGPVEPARLIDLELLCTDAFLLYGSHLLTGRVSPTTTTPSWTLKGRQANLVQHLERALTSPSLRPALALLRPSHSGYVALRKALAQYRDFAREGEWPSVLDGLKLEEGVSDPRVSRLRQRLQRTGDFSSDSLSSDSLTFGAPLRQAVTRFQKRHGLAVDGVVGPATRAALNVPVERRIEQIKVNLERWRWLPADLGALHVRVNIAGFKLQVVDDGTDLLRMRVVTGRAHRQTPMFSDQISYLVFNPYWHVPHSIAVKDKLPDLQRNPARVSAQGFEVLRGWGADAVPIDPSTIDWRRLSASNFPYRLRHNEDWSRERIEKTIGGNTEQTVLLTQKVPVHLLYWTAQAEAGQPVQFRRDVYGRDKAVYAALMAPLNGPREPGSTPAGGRAE